MAETTVRHIRSVNGRAFKLPTRALATVGELASIFGVARETIDYWRALRNFPDPLLREGRSVYFSMPAVALWIESHGGTVNHEAEK